MVPTYHAVLMALNLELEQFPSFIKLRDEMRGPTRLWILCFYLLLLRRWLLWCPALRLLQVRYAFGFLLLLELALHVIELPLPFARCIFFGVSHFAFVIFLRARSFAIGFDSVLLDFDRVSFLCSSQSNRLLLYFLLLFG